MEGETSHRSLNIFNHSMEKDPIFADNDQEIDGRSVALDASLPTDILGKILSFLPVISIIRAGAVCKRWHDTIYSMTHWWTSIPPQKPIYFMFTCSQPMSGYAYDPTFRKWHSFDFPFFLTDNWFVSSSSGLICFMDFENWSRIYVCNPITKSWKQLQEPIGVKSADHCAVALSVDHKCNTYTVAVVKSKHVPNDLFHWDICIQVYNSATNTWVAPVREVLAGWRGGDEGVICDGILYFLIYSFMGNEPRHSLIMFDLNSWISSDTCLMSKVVRMPCSLTCGRLMNLKDRLIMVGGIVKTDRTDIIKEICIWELYNREWREIARMPHKVFQGFGEFDDVFASSGSEDLIYIQSFGSPALLTFDMSQRHWRWSVKCPATKRFPLQLFSGFCFEPRLAVTP